MATARAVLARATTYLASMALAPLTNRSCPILGIPVELRLEIFHLVLDADYCYMTLPLSDEDDVWFTKPFSRRSHRNGAPPSTGKILSILLANRQLYSEAVSVLYGNATIVTPSKGHWQYNSFQPGCEYKCLPGYAFRHRSSYSYYKCLDDESHSNSTGALSGARMSDLSTYVYYDSTLVTVNKLDRLLVSMPFNFSRALPIHWDENDAPDFGNRWTYHSTNFTLDPDLEKFVKRLFKQAKSVKGFVEKIKKVSWIEHLDLEIYVETCPPLAQSMNQDSDSVESCREIWRQGDLEVADMFLESRILDPLQEVENVGSWCIAFTVIDDSEEKLAHERLELNLTNAVEKKKPESKVLKAPSKFETLPAQTRQWL